ncbi:Uncharacterised protein [Mycobacteroides abscessus subsp. massiliense]|nr:Uncharacterised protein [Mycobacteroides abscessus subsp. massiliense]
MTRPTWASVYSENPAKTSAMRENRRFSSGLSVFHGRTESASTATSLGNGLMGVSLVSLGRMPLSIMRASTHSRYAS